MKKKKRKRDEIDYHDPNQRMHPPPGANPAGVSNKSLAITDTKQSKQNQSCPICRATRFEWGVLTPSDNYMLYKSHTIPNGKVVRTRRCLNCENLQIFTKY